MKLLTFDIETWGLQQEYLLQPWKAKEKKSGIVSLVIGDHAKHAKKWADNEPIFNLFNIIKELSDDDPNTYLCGWNLLFDLSFLIAVGGEDMYRFLHGFKFLDGMLLFKRLAGIYKTSNREVKYSLLGKETKSAALKSVLALYNEDINFKQIIGVGYKENYNDVDFKAGKPVYNDKKMLAYNLRDTLYTHAFIDWLVKHSTKRELTQAIRESTILLPFARAWTDGIWLDIKKTHEARRLITKTQKDTLEELGKKGISKNMIASPKQLSEHLERNLGLTLDITQKGNASVNETSLQNVLSDLDSDDERMPLIIGLLSYKKRETELTKFIKPIDELENPMHPQPFLQSTVTGRLTYSVSQTVSVPKIYKNGKTATTKKSFRIGLPMHQMKRGHIRDIIVAPERKNIIEIDFAAQEMRIIAWLANEATMISFFNEGKDLHALMGANLSKIPYLDFLKLKETDAEKYKEWRTIGKVTNLALQYRLSHSGLHAHWKKSGIDKTITDAERARLVYLTTFTGIERYWTQSILTARTNGLIKNKAGRKLLISDWSYGQEWNSSQTAINFPVQSLGADMKILALYKLMPFLKRTGIEFKWDLHDGLYFYVPNCEMQHELICEMKEIVEKIDYAKAWKCDKPPVKFPVEVKLGKRWGKLKEVNFS